MLTWVSIMTTYFSVTCADTLRKIGLLVKDAMPDGWGERLLHRAYGKELGTLDFLLKSPNNACSRPWRWCGANLERPGEIRCRM